MAPDPCCCWPWPMVDATIFRSACSPNGFSSRSLPSNGNGIPKYEQQRRAFFQVMTKLPIRFSTTSTTVSSSYPVTHQEMPQALQRGQPHGDGHRTRISISQPTRLNSSITCSYPSYNLSKSRLWGYHFALHFGRDAIHQPETDLPQVLQLVTVNPCWLGRLWKGGVSWDHGSVEDFRRCNGSYTANMNC